jgi:hypothetical protein
MGTVSTLPQIYKWSRPLLTGTAPQTEISITYRKQTTGKFPTGVQNMHQGITHLR